MLPSKPSRSRILVGVIWRVWRITFDVFRCSGVNKDESYESCDLLRGDADESRRKRATSHAARIHQACRLCGRQRRIALLVICPSVRRLTKTSASPALSALDSELSFPWAQALQILLPKCCLNFSNKRRSLLHYRQCPSLSQSPRPS